MSARCRARMREKWPTSADSSIFCLSMAAKKNPSVSYAVSRATFSHAILSQQTHKRKARGGDSPGWLEDEKSLGRFPLELLDAMVLLRLDML